MVEEDLTPAELAAFHAALESEEVGRMVQPWVPWWTLEAARDVRLGARGLSLIEEGMAGCCLDGGQWQGSTTWCSSCRCLGQPLHGNHTTRSF